MKYPTQSRGLSVSPYELGFTIPPERNSFNRRNQTVHHNYWERPDYRFKRLHSVFRNLVTNTYPLLANEHIDLHDYYSAPPKPKDSVMVDVIEEYLSLNGTIDCVREKRTRDVYQITVDEWQVIRSGHVQVMESARN